MVEVVKVSDYVPVRDTSPECLSDFLRCELVDGLWVLETGWLRVLVEPGVSYPEEVFLKKKVFSWGQEFRAVLFDAVETESGVLLTYEVGSNGAL